MGSYSQNSRLMKITRVVIETLQIKCAYYQVLLFGEYSQNTWIHLNTAAMEGEERGGRILYLSCQVGFRWDSQKRSSCKVKVHQDLAE